MKKPENEAVVASRELLCQFRCDYIAEFADGTTLRIHDIERHLVFFPGEGEGIWFPPESSKKIEAAIEDARPGYFRHNAKADSSALAD